MSVPEIIAAVFLLAGGLLMLLAAVGVVRFPDFYSRLHAGGKGDTMGQALVGTGLIVLAISGAATGTDIVKLILIAFFVFIFNATATHALARAAWVAGLKPWTQQMQEGHPEVRQFEDQMDDADREALFIPVRPADASEPEGVEEGDAS